MPDDGRPEDLKAIDRYVTGGDPYYKQMPWYNGEDEPHA